MSKAYEVKWDDDMKSVTLVLRNDSAEDGSSAAGVVAMGLAAACGMASATIDTGFNGSDGDNADLEDTKKVRAILDGIVSDILAQCSTDAIIRGLKTVRAAYNTTIKAIDAEK